MKKIIFILFFFSYCTSKSVLNNSDGSKVVSIYKKDKIFKRIYYNSRGFKEKENFNYVLGEFTQSKFYNEKGILNEELLFTKFEADTILVGRDSIFGSNSFKWKVFSVPSYQQKLFYEDGKIKSIGFFKRAKKDSVFKYFDQKGKLLIEEYYNLDSLIKKIDY